MIANLDNDNLFNVLSYAGFEAAINLTGVCKALHTQVHEIEENQWLINKLFEDTLYQQLKAQNLHLNEISIILDHIVPCKRIITYSLKNENDIISSDEALIGRPKKFKEISLWVEGLLAVIDLEQELNLTNNKSKTISDALDKAKKHERDPILLTAFMHLKEKDNPSYINLYVYDWLKDFNRFKSSNLELAKTIFNLCLDWKTLPLHVKMKVLAACVNVDQSLFEKAYPIAKETFKLSKTDSLPLFNACLKVNPQYAPAVFQMITGDDWKGEQLKSKMNEWQTSYELNLLGFCVGIYTGLERMDSFPIMEKVVNLIETTKNKDLINLTYFLGNYLNADKTQGKRFFDLIKKKGCMIAKANILTSWAKAEPSIAPQIFNYVKNELNLKFQKPNDEKPKRDIIEFCLDSNKNIDFFNPCMEMAKEWKTVERFNVFKLILSLSLAPNKPFSFNQMKVIFEFIDGFKDQDTKKEALKKLVEFDKRLALNILEQSTKLSNEMAKAELFLAILKQDASLAKAILDIASTWKTDYLQKDVFIACVKANTDLKAEVLKKITGWKNSNAKNLVTTACQNLKRKIAETNPTDSEANRKKEF